ncbi:MAG: DMT family transporter [Pseudomonadota bacterium]
MTDTTKGIWLMVIAMFCFNLSDAFIKEMSKWVGFGQILMFMGVGGFLFTAFLCLQQGTNPFDRRLLSWPVMIRMAGEVLGAAFIFVALATSDLSLVSSVVQASPLLIAAAAAIILKETVGWRRWSAILVGFLGVLLIINPFQAAFDWQVLYSVAAMIFLTVRDFSTRFVPQSISAIQMSALGFIGIIPVGWAVMQFGQSYVVYDIGDWGLMGLIVLFAAFGAIAIAAGMRMGDVSAVAPFRYSRMIFAVTLGYFMFGEWPSPIMWIGIIMVFGSGLFLLLRERALHQQSPNS